MGFPPFFFHPAIGYPIYGTPHIPRFVDDESISPSPKTSRLFRAVWLSVLVTCGFPMLQKNPPEWGRMGNPQEHHGFQMFCSFFSDDVTMFWIQSHQLWDIYEHMNHLHGISEVAEWDSNGES